MPRAYRHGSTTTGTGGDRVPMMTSPGMTPPGALPPGTLAAQGFFPTPSSPYANRVTTVGRLGGIPQQQPMQPQQPQQPGMVQQPFAQRLATQAQTQAQGGFDFRRPTGPVSMAGANHRTQGFAASTPHRFSGTAFGGSNPRTASSVGSMSRLSPRVGMG